MHTKKSPGSLYGQLADELRQGIAQGRWKNGDLLPSEAQLCELHGISRGTAVRAIEQLVAEGLAQRRQGVGTFVTRTSLHRQPGFLLSFSETVRAEGRTPSQQVRYLRNIDRSRAIQFGCLEAGVELFRLRLVDGTPCATHRSILPRKVARQLPALNHRPGLEPDRSGSPRSGCGEGELEHPSFSLYRALEGAGFHIDSGKEWLRARLASEEETRLLRMPASAAVMVVLRKSFDRQGQLLESVEAVYRGDSYVCELNLKKVLGKPENKPSTIGG